MSEFMEFVSRYEGCTLEALEQIEKDLYEEEMRLRIKLQANKYMQLVKKTGYRHNDVYKNDRGQFGRIEYDKRFKEFKFRQLIKGTRKLSKISTVTIIPREKYKYFLNGHEHNSIHRVQNNKKYEQLPPLS